MTKKSAAITRDMTIAELMEKFPETEEIMLEYGLHCVGCAINEFDTIAAGAEIHGMSDEEIEALLTDLNASLEKPRAYENKHIRVTEKAILKLIQLRREAGSDQSSGALAKGEGDKVLVEFAEDDDGKREYFLELVEDKLPMHEEILIGGIPFLFVKEFVGELKGLLIDYKETFAEEGFTFRQTGCCQEGESNK